MTKTPFAILTSILSAGLALLPAGEASAQEIRFNVVPYRLDNGLKILALEDHAVPSMTYYTFFRVGSRNERPGRTGISHLFEHMMFNGATKYGPGVFDRQLESRGGASNAFTTEDMTAYDDVFPAEALDLVVDMEADRLAALQIGEESLKSEREVVKEERRLRIDNESEGSMFELLQGTAYLAHPYQWPVAGWIPDLDAITVDDCKEYFRSHYAPNNATIVLVGDFKPDKAIDLISKAYGAMPAQPPFPAVVRDEPEQKGERRAILRREAELPAVGLAWHVPAVGATELYALDLLEILLGGGESSRLVRTLVYDKELATRVEVSNEWRLDPSLFFVYAEAKPGVTAEALETAIQEQIDAVVAGGVSDGDLRKVKNIRTTSLVKELKTNHGKAEQIGLFDAWFGNYQKLFTVLKDYEAVKAADLALVASRFLRADNRTAVTLVPTPAAGGAAGTEVGR